MKFFIAIVLFAALASAEYQVKTHDDLLKYRAQCVEEHKIPAAAVEQYKKWDFPNNKPTQCYLKCILEKFGLFDEVKGFNVEDIHHQVVGDHADHSDDTHAKIEACAKEAVGDDACVKAYLGAMCFIRENLNLVKKSVDAHDHDHSEHEQHH